MTRNVSGLGLDGVTIDGVCVSWDVLIAAARQDTRAPRRLEITVWSLRP